MWLRKALATFGSGPAAEALALALPTFRAYASRHDYEIVIGNGAACGRPASWGKVGLLRRLLAAYDFVVWLDADALILDTRTDLESIVPADAFQAFAVTTSTLQGDTSPCLGVWALRAGDRTHEFLAAVWAQADLTDHRWWEQAAAMRLLGWTIEYPLYKERPSEWDAGTFILGEEWDMIPMSPAVGYAPGYIRHYGGWAYRRRLFDMRTDLARLRGHRLRYWLGVLERRWRPHYWPVSGEIRFRMDQLGAILRRSR